MTRLVLALCAAFLICLTAGPGAAQENHDHSAAAPDAKLGDLAVSGGWVRAMLPGQKAAGAYLTVSNSGTAPDRLVSAASLSAGRVEVHSMSVIDDVMVMRPVPDGLDVPAGGAVALEPGGLHLMLMEVEAPLADGAEVPLTLRFEKAGEMRLTLPVRKAQDGRHSHGG